MSELLKILITFKAIGRGGGVKFISYQRMFFDQHFNMLFTQWFQRKTLKSSPVGFVPDFKTPEACVFMALGCFWSTEDGLLREPGQGAAYHRASAFMFLDF